ncbi:MAG: hypothetical protein WCF17_11050 [Terracidiphilus sp.]
MRTSFALFRLPFVAALLTFSVSSILHSQATAAAGAELRLLATDFHTLNSDSSSISASNLPDAPDFSVPAAAGAAGQDQHGEEPWEGVRHYGPLSRASIGADVSPLGIGIKGAVILTQYLDGRLLVNFFSHDFGNMEIDTFKGDPNLHLLSVGAALDVYPRNSIWRLSGGLMLHNGNNISMTAEIVPGNSFKLNGQTFYSASPNAATGVAPINGTGTLGLDSRQPELFVSGGFGRFVPRSNRHWSFPAEFGAIFMGAPTIDINASGWVCKDSAQTNCSNIGDSSNPLAAQFNSALQAAETKWRHSAQSFTIYPMFSYSVVYSFDIK